MPGFSQISFRLNELDKPDNENVTRLSRTRAGIGPITTPVQPATPVGGKVQIKQLIVVPDRVPFTIYFVL